MRSSAKDDVLTAFLFLFFLRSECIKENGQMPELAIPALSPAVTVLSLIPFNLGLTS